MNLPVPPLPVIDSASDASAVLTTDAPCRKCAYNLRGLPIDGRCPECGTPVGFSIKGDLLQFSQPEWLGTLRAGVKLILYSIVVLIFGTVLAIIVSVTWRPGRMPVIAMPTVIFAVMSLLGGWKVTTPDPSGLGENQYGTSRKLIRIGLALGLINTALTLMFEVFTLPAIVVQIVVYLSMVIQITGIITAFAQLYYFNKLALRIPDDKLAERARFLMYALGTTEAASLALRYALRLILNLRIVRAAGAMRVVTGLNMIVGLCLLVFGIMYLSMLVKFGKRFKEAAAIARSVWREPTAV